MKFAILSRGPDLYSTRRLITAAKAQGHTVKVLDTLDFSILMRNGEPLLYYRGKKLADFDAIIPRIGASITHFGTAVVRQFEQMGVYCLNSSNAISVSRDKLRCMQVLSRHRVGMPTTAFVRRQDQIMGAIDLVGGAPVVIKTLEGTQGAGVILAETARTAESIIEALQNNNQPVLIQSFVKESKGKDIRAFVVGGQVVAAMQRTATGDEFRSNVHRGGSTLALQLEPEYERVAVQAAQILGLQVAGVDMLIGSDGPKVLEVNSSPGLEGIEKSTQVGVAEAIIRHLEDQVPFPEVDIRQRMTVEKGYGVAEVLIDEKSELVGKKVADSGLKERDVLILSMMRGNVHIPNPRMSREIQPGDHLLLWGKLDSIRALIPIKPAKSSKGKRKAAAAMPEVTPARTIHEAVEARRSGTWRKV